MRKRRIYLALVGLGIVIGGIVVFSKAEREPEYGGKKLSEWVEGYGESFVGNDSHPPPLKDDPIYRIGTNGIPFLLRWLQYEQPPWKRSLDGGVNFVLGKVNSDWGIRDHRELRARGSAVAFYILGPAGAGAVTDLTRIANDPKAPASASRARSALLFFRLGESNAEHERSMRQLSSNALEKAAAP